MAQVERVTTPWDAVEALLDGAFDQPADTRAEWVRSNAGSEDLAREVIALLAAAGRRGVLDMEIPSELVHVDSTDTVIERLSSALDGRYRIEGVLGQGGTATVFLAHEIKHGRQVVLKVLRPEVAKWVGADRFLREIRILAQLSHPHIVALIDSGEADGLLYYVMPHVGGETLRDRLARGALPYKEALPILRDIAAALAQAHGERMIHRDLKPDNILIVSGHAYLMDFGIAKLKPELTTGGTTLEGFALGTPRYMSPEQAAGKKMIDQRTDLYSWGIVACETLTGSVSEDASVPRSVPRKLRDLIDRCLEATPDKRPADAGELLASIQLIPEDITRNTRRALWLTVVVAIVAAVIAALGTLKFFTH